MASIFDDTNMRDVLSKHIYEGERLIAGVHGVSVNIETVTVLPNYIYFEDKLLPTEPGKNILKVRKTKYSRFDVYIGMTEDALIISECEPQKWLYEIENLIAETPLPVDAAAKEMRLTDIGVRFPFAFMEDCRINKIWMGAYRCTITMESGSVVTFILPKRGGLGGGMPHHTQYRQRILERLEGFSRPV